MKVRTKMPKLTEPANPEPSKAQFILSVIIIVAFLLCCVLWMIFGRDETDEGSIPAPRMAACGAMMSAGQTV